MTTKMKDPVRSLLPKNKLADKKKKGKKKYKGDI